MKVAVWINKSMDPKLGGGFSYTSKLLQLIDDKQFNFKLEICFIGSEAISFRLNKPYFHVDLTAKKLSILNQFIVSFSRKFRILKGLKNKIQSNHRSSYIERIHKRLKENQIDIIYYLAPMELYVPKFPFISTNWDLGHLTLPPFPEITEENELAVRTKWYDKTLLSAKYVFVESEAGKKELVELLSYPKEKIKVVPIFPGNLVNLKVSLEQQKVILQKFNIEKNNFFMYPAQFWKHKNHERLISAFAKVSKDNIKLKLILNGSDKGELENVLKFIDSIGISDQVNYVGFLSNEELFTLYKNASALVFPSLLGPTNMPPLEARAIGCPVLCSDFVGHKEQLGDGALYFNPENEDEIAKSMMAMLDERERKALQEKATAEFNNSKFKGNIAVSKIEEHLLAISI
ncbi:glycosyltransferase family 1 protein [uncultured Winogradskyella sp.]|uniref:glycosyltransferase family 4 protein n=1 Tax=uncultured Winogradskyella sp. TaxID=395353 RepID=UPI002638C32A|nr:glycosyltransferase family 1 protein [uncultured Winogradskyella sp.]